VGKAGRRTPALSGLALLLLASRERVGRVELCSVYAIVRGNMSSSDEVRVEDGLEEGAEEEGEERTLETLE
jgi:hypothetical protein